MEQSSGVTIDVYKNLDIKIQIKRIMDPNENIKSRPKRSLQIPISFSVLLTETNNKNTKIKQFVSK